MIIGPGKECIDSGLFRAPEGFDYFFIGKVVEHLFIPFPGLMGKSAERVSSDTEP
jgi:hypothetical protein